MPRYKKAYEGERRTRRRFIMLTPTEDQRLAESAEAAGAQFSEHVRELCLRRSTEGGGPRRNPQARALAHDADLARRIMEFDALNQTSKTKRCVKDCVHLALAWRPGEQPTREQMEAAARGAMASIGMANAKAIFAAHNDEDYVHLHIVASKINPETGKAYDLKRSQLKLSKWAEQYERDNGGIVCTRRAEANQLRDAIDRRDAGAVLQVMTTQRSTFTGRDLARVLDKQIAGEFDRAQFAEKVLTHPDAVRLADQAQGRTTRYSSRQVLEAEQHVLRAADGLARNDRHQVGERILASVLSDKKFDGISREQALAYRHATGGQGLAVIDGQAGTGKSFTMAAIREAYEAQSYKVVGLAPTNAVAQDMQGDGFARARTVHSELFSLNNDRTQWDRRTVVMVDEAAMIDTRNMAMLTAHAYAAGAKLILIGDDRQLSSIERGGMFGVLKDRYGAAELATVRRQHKHAEFSAGDRIQFTGTDKQQALYNGQAGTVKAIDGSTITVELDGRGNRAVAFDAGTFKDFRHGYAGTIYKGQGRTLDQTYLYHSEHWRSAASYVGLTRHRDKAELFVATNTAPDLKQLARQMARVDDRRAASHFHQANDRDPVRPLTPRELAARFSDPALQRHAERADLARRQEEESTRRQTPAVESAAKAERQARSDPGLPAADKTSEADRRLERLLNGLSQEHRAAGRDRNDGGRTSGGRSRTR